MRLKDEKKAFHMVFAEANFSQASNSVKSWWLDFQESLCRASLEAILALIIAMQFQDGEADGLDVLTLVMRHQHLKIRHTKDR